MAVHLSFGGLVWADLKRPHWTWQKTLPTWRMEEKLCDLRPSIVLGSVPALSRSDTGRNGFLSPVLVPCLIHETGWLADWREVCIDGSGYTQSILVRKAWWWEQLGPWGWQHLFTSNKEQFGPVVRLCYKLQGPDLVDFLWKPVLHEPKFHHFSKEIMSQEKCAWGQKPTSHFISKS